MKTDAEKVAEPAAGDPIFDAVYALLKPQMEPLFARELARRSAMLAYEKGAVTPAQIKASREEGYREGWEHADRHYEAIALDDAQVEALKLEGRAAQLHAHDRYQGGVPPIRWDKLRAGVKGEYRYLARMEGRGEPQSADEVARAAERMTKAQRAAVIARRTEGWVTRNRLVGMSIAARRTRQNPLILTPLGEQVRALLTEAQRREGG